jgi:hypothetical protein
MRFLIAFFLLLPGLLHGQVYQYIDPETGSKKFTNIRPSWYSPGLRQPGPRTLVIVRDKVIDDTSKPVNADQVQHAFQDAQLQLTRDDEQRAARLAIEAQAAAHKAQVRTAQQAERDKAQTMDRAAADEAFQRQVRRVEREREVAATRAESEADSRRWQNEMRHRNDLIRGGGSWK